MVIQKTPGRFMHDKSAVYMFSEMDSEPNESSYKSPHQDLKPELAFSKSSETSAGVCAYYIFTYTLCMKCAYHIHAISCV